MKRFIYLDTDELNSYIAQIYNGLSVEKQEMKENGKNIKRENQSTLGTKLNIGMKIKSLFKLQGEVNTKITENDLKEKSEAIRDIEKKIIHDESFDNFLNYLKKEKMLKEDEYKVGDFIKSNSNFKIFDLNYFLKLFEENGFVDYLNSINRKEVQETIEAGKSKLNREKRRENKDEIAKIEQQAEEAVKEQEDEYINIKKIIEVIKSIMPYEKIILVDKFFLATDDKYFRDNPEMLGFKYGGEISFVGYITNIVEQKEESSSEGIDALTGFKKLVNSTILNFISNRQILVVHPIAIYYE